MTGHLYRTPRTTGDGNIDAEKGDLVCQKSFNLRGPPLLPVVTGLIFRGGVYEALVVA